MSTPLRIILGLAFLQAPFAPLVGQDTTACGGTPMARLQGLIGNWTIRTTERLAPGQYQESEGSAQISQLFPCALQEIRIGILEHRRYVAVALVSALSNSEEVQYAHLDSEHGGILLSAGAWKQDTLVLEWINAMDDRTMRISRRLFDITPDSFVVEHHLRTRDDASWQLTWRGEYTRSQNGSRETSSGMLGEFEDDYGIRYVITPTSWRQGAHTEYHLVQWDTAGRSIVAQNDEANPSGGGLWTRIDWIQLDDMEPYQWAYCLTVYEAATKQDAEDAEPALRGTPRTGCNGFPFSRMRRPADTTIGGDR